MLALVVNGMSSPRPQALRHAAHHREEKGSRILGTCHAMNNRKSQSDKLECHSRIRAQQPYHDMVLDP